MSHGQTEGMEDEFDHIHDKKAHAPNAGGGADGMYLALVKNILIVVRIPVPSAIAATALKSKPRLSFCNCNSINKSQSDVG